MFRYIYHEFPRAAISYKAHWKRIIGKPDDVASLEGLLQKAEEREGQAELFDRALVAKSWFVHIG